MPAPRPKRRDRTVSIERAALVPALGNFACDGGAEGGAANLLHKGLQRHCWLTERSPNALLNAERRPNALLDRLQALGSAQANG